MSQIEANPIELAEALLASIYQEQHPARLDRRTMDLEAWRSLDRLALDIFKAVRGKVNLHAPVSRLPPEVLVQVFDKVPTRCIFDTAKEASFNNLRDTSELLPLMAVCRHWRELALATPSLWSSIYLQEPQPENVTFYTQHIHRYTHGPISVGLSWITFRWGVEASEIQSVLEEVRERVTELYVEEIEEKGHSSILTLPRFPNLERCVCRSFSPSETGTQHSFTFCDSPRLRFLELKDVPSLPSNAYPALTHLWIIGPCSEGDFGQLLLLLSSTPQLRTLTLEGLHKLPLTAARSLHANLPLLGQLKLTYYRWKPETALVTQAFRRALFSSVTIPSSCTVDAGDMLVDDLLPSARLLPHISSLTPLDMNVNTFCGYQRVTLRFKNEAGPLAVLSLLCGVILNPTAPAFDGVSYEFSAAAALFAVLPQITPAIRKFCMVPDLYRVRGGHHREVISMFPHTESLRVRLSEKDLRQLSKDGASQPARKDHLANTLDALQPEDADGDEAGARQLPCPELTRLWLDFHRGGLDGGPRMALMDRLQRAADARTARGHPLSRVFITSRRPLLDSRGVQYAYAAHVDEYDGSVTRVLRSTQLERWDDGGAGPSLECLLERECGWDQVEEV